MAMNFVTFNQDYSHLSVGTTRGFRTFTTDPFSKSNESRDGNISMIEMLFSTSIVALVPSPRRLHIRNTKRGTMVCELTFPTTILAIRMNRKRLIVVLEDVLYLYNMENMSMLYTLETSPNPTAICALSPSSENCYIAYPLPQKSLSTPAHVPPNSTHISTTSGDLLLFDAVRKEAINVIEAHKSPLSCVMFNNEGTLLATASDKGTIIRVFSIPDGHKLYQFRRGSMPARIYSMSFNAASTLLCVSSASDTIHIFKLGPPGTGSSNDEATSPVGAGSISPRKPRSASESSNYAGDEDTEQNAPSELNPRKPNGTFMGLIRRTSQNVGTSLAGSLGGYMPKSVTEMWEPSRDFAWLKIPKPASGQSQGSMRSIVAMSPNAPQVMVVTNDGGFYVFQIDLAKGGEGTLIKQYSVLDVSNKIDESLSAF